LRLLLDEHYSPEVAHQLRHRGHDVIAGRELPELHGLSDGELLAVATRKRRAVVTENVVDFVELHRSAALTGTDHFGIIFTSPRRFPRTRRAIGRLVRALDALLAACPTDEALRGQTWWLER
jgi:predicted nuclease of predicted toxin-antitoxin system